MRDANKQSGSSPENVGSFMSHSGSSPGTSHDSFVCSGSSPQLHLPAFCAVVLIARSKEISIRKSSPTGAFVCPEEAVPSLAQTSGVTERHSRRRSK